MGLECTQFRNLLFPIPNLNRSPAPAEFQLGGGRQRRRERERMGRFGRVGAVGVVIAGIVLCWRYGWEWDKDAAVELFRQWSDRLGFWAIPVYVSVHTLTLALCLPYAVFFEAAASLLFGFFPAVLCVFSAKLLGASLSFWIGRFLSFFLSFSFPLLLSFFLFSFSYLLANSLLVVPFDLDTFKKFLL